jgi:hypothetical protein
MRNVFKASNVRVRADEFISHLHLAEPRSRDTKTSVTPQEEEVDHGSHNH